MILNEISEQLMLGRAPKVKELVINAVQEGIEPSVIINDALIGGMEIVGERFKKNEIFVPEVMMAARSMKLAMEVLKPLIKADTVASRGTVVIGTVKGDQHDIGKNLVSVMLESKGFRVIDLGVNVTAEKFVETAKNEKADIIACSALLTTTMTYMKSIVELVSTSFDRKVYVMVGGAPVTGEFAENIGADGYSPDAAAAADLALSLVK